MDADVERRFLRLENEVKRLRVMLGRKVVGKGSVAVLDEEPFVCEDPDCDGEGRSKTNIGIALPCWPEHVKERERKKSEERIANEVAEKLRRKKVRMGLKVGEEDVK